MFHLSLKKKEELRKMKLLIVDDEKKIVEFLLRAIDWEKFGYTEIRSFTSSKEAILTLDTGYTPDLMITDIKMPEVSGLDLAQKMQGKSKIIVLSGYSDFEYAQQSIRYGVSDYLLKPVFPNELEKAVNQVTEELSAERFTREVSPIGFYLAILSGKINESLDFQKTLDKLILRGYTPGVIDFGVKPILKFTWNHKTYGFSQNEGKGLPNRSDIQKAFFEEIFDMPVPNDIKPFAELEIEVNNQRWKELIHSLNRPVYLDDTAENILTKLKIIQQLFEKQPEIFAKGRVSDVLALCYQNHLANFLYSNLDHAITEIEDSNQTILIVQEQIRKNLSAPLSVEWLAEKVHMHPVYLSRIYKQETGTNLSQYILYQRLNKMKELLLTTDLKVKTITELVGYRKPQNIIEAFKKEYGLTPSQYRKQRKG